MNNADFRVLVTGGRDFGNHELAHGTLSNVHSIIPITHLIEGGAKGADEIAGQWATQHGIDVKTEITNWESMGTGEGHARNARLLDKYRPHLVVAFHGGLETNDMVNQAKDAGVPLLFASSLGQDKFEVLSYIKHIRDSGVKGNVATPSRTR